MSWVLTYRHFNPAFTSNLQIWELIEMQTITWNSTVHIYVYSSIESAWYTPRPDAFILWVYTLPSVLSLSSLACLSIFPSLQIIYTEIELVHQCPIGNGFCMLLIKLLSDYLLDTWLSKIIYTVHLQLLVNCHVSLTIRSIAIFFFSFESSVSEFFLPLFSKPL